MLARLGAPHDLAAVILAVEPPFTGPLIDSEGSAAGREAPVRVTVYRFVDDPARRLNAARRRNSAPGQPTGGHVTGA
jgi:hypothetical protein